jgi:hypothetical protein
VSEDIPGDGYALPLHWVCEAGPMLDAPYIIRNVIGPGELAVIYGAPKSGKTFLATDLALRVAVGLPWFGHRVHEGTVIYVASEMGARVNRRMYAWIKKHGYDHDEIHLGIIPKVVNLLDKDDLVDLFKTVAKLKKEGDTPVLVIIDTLARSMSGGDENTAQHMGMAISVTDKLRDRFNTATALIHHAGKDPGKGTRGSSSLLGAVDTAIYVDADDAGNHRVKIEWSRDGESGQEYSFRLPIFELGQNSEGDTVTTCVLEQSEATPKVKRPVRVDVAFDSFKETVAKYGQKLNGSSSIPKGVLAITIDQWRAQWALRTGYDDSHSISVNFYKDKAKLLASGKIQISKPYSWLTE